MKKIFYKHLNSTNEYGKNNITDLEDKSIIIAETQSSGYGRFKRKWISDKPDNLYASIILKPDFGLNKNLPLTNLTQYTSIIICETLEQYGVKAEIKWPNDVLILGKKIAGFLAETSTQNNIIKGLVLGIGINLNLEEADLNRIDQPATALNLEINKKIDTTEFSEKLFNAFFKEYDNFMLSGFEYIKSRYTSKCSFIGKEILIKNPDTEQKGIVKDINNDGSLLLEENNSYTTVIVGDLIY